MRAAVYNPKGLPESELPTIYGFNNGGRFGLLEGVLISQDGYVLGIHSCSHEAYMTCDLGVADGYREDRHENEFRPHYPDGYRMEFVGYADVKAHEGLQQAFSLHILNRERMADEERSKK